jgi:hypothetical protein
MGVCRAGSGARGRESRLISWLDSVAEGYDIAVGRRPMGRAGITA